MAVMWVYSLYKRCEPTQPYFSQKELKKQAQVIPFTPEHASEHKLTLLCLACLRSCIQEEVLSNFFILQEEQKELDEITAKRQKKGKNEEDAPAEEKTILHGIANPSNLLLTETECFFRA